MFAEESKKRQERKPEDGKEVAFDALEKLGAKPLKLIRADGIQGIYADTGKIVVDKSRGKIAHGQARYREIMPNPLARARDDHRGR